LIAQHQELADYKQLPLLASMLWELHQSLHFLCINSVPYCLKRLHQMAPTAFEKARLFLLSQCDPDSPGEFKPLPKADDVLLDHAITMLKTEKGGRSAEAKALLSVLKDKPRHGTLSGYGPNSDDYYSDS
jgi:hypothetical protein